MQKNNIGIYGIIYKITNKVNGKVYIGQTTEKRGFDGRYHFRGNDIERVYLYHYSYKKRNRHYNKHLLDSINKYGFENFEVTKTLDVAFSRIELNIKEQIWIKYYDSFKNGYNYTTGGEGFNLSKETKEKISYIRIKKGIAKGNKNPQYGKKGVLSPNFGKHHSKETRIKISQSNMGKRHTIESKIKMSLTKKKNCSSKGGKNPHASKIICITTGEIFDCISEASIKYFGKNKSRIGACCLGKSKYSGKLKDGTKLKWMYYNEYINKSNSERALL